MWTSGSARCTAPVSSSAVRWPAEPSRADTIARRAAVTRPPRRRSRSRMRSSRSGSATAATARERTGGTPVARFSAGTLPRVRRVRGLAAAAAVVFVVSVATVIVRAPRPSVADVVRTTADEVAAVRGLRWLHPLSVAVVDRGAVVARAAAAARREVPPGPADAAQATFAFLHLLPSDLDYAATVVSLASAGRTAFYDGTSGRLVVAGQGGRVTGAGRVELATELDRALVDEHFGPTQRGHALNEAGRGDEAAALGAVADGDATLTTALWARRHLGARDRAAVDAERQTATALASAPPFIRNAMLFGSTTGFRLVRDRWQAAGFAGVDSLYRSPPGSTAQVLHPLRRPLGPTPPPPVLPNLGATGCTPVR